jgi:hypothetical protein
MFATYPVVTVHVCRPHDGTGAIGIGVGKQRRVPKPTAVPASPQPTADVRKIKKNQKEKERRLMVNEKLEELAMLVGFDAQARSDKVSVLNRAIAIITDSAETIRVRAVRCTLCMLSSYCSCGTLQSLQEELNTLQLAGLSARRSPVTASHASLPVDAAAPSAPPAPARIDGTPALRPPRSQRALTVSVNPQRANAAAG